MTDQLFTSQQLIQGEADTETLIILHITKTESNNCFIMHFELKIIDMARKTIKNNQHADNSVICQPITDPVICYYLLDQLSADCVIVAFIYMQLTNHKA